MVLITLAVTMTACGGGGGAGGGLLGLECLFCDLSNVKIKIKPTIRANVGWNQSVVEGDTVVLAGGVSPANGCIARYEWRQTHGPKVGINGSTDLHQRFTAPAVETTKTLTFKLRAWCSNSDRKDDDSMDVIVESTTVSALCSSAPLYVNTHIWANSSCTSNKADIAGDVRVATLYRQSESEPNDSTRAANALAFPIRVAGERIATDIAGSVSGSADRKDYYLISPPVTGLYEINLCNDPVACARGTVTERWGVSLLDQDLSIIAATSEIVVDEQTLWIDLDAGLPYYIGVHAVDSSSSRWNYNLTVLSEGD